MITTEEEKLFEVLKDMENEIELVYDESNMGVMIMGVYGYESDFNNNEFYAILVDGEPAEVGAGELNIQDGSVYTIELDTF